jgi:hypothetical protein
MATPTSMNLDTHLAMAGPAAESFARLWVKLWQQDLVGAELLELCRLTLARLHSDAAEIAATNSFLPATDAAAKRSQAILAGRAHEDPAFSPAEKAALQFAELYWMDAQSIGDEAAEEVKAHFGEPGLVLLIEALGCIDGRIRTARCLRDIAAHTSN